MFCEQADRLLPDGDVAVGKVFHIVRALHVIVDHSFTRAAKCLDGINFSLLQDENTSITGLLLNLKKPLKALKSLTYSYNFNILLSQIQRS